MLGNTGDPKELFLVDSCEDSPLAHIKAKCFVSAFYDCIIVICVI